MWLAEGLSKPTCLDPPTDTRGSGVPVSVLALFTLFPLELSMWGLVDLTTPHKMDSKSLISLEPEAQVVERLVCSWWGGPRSILMNT